MPVISVGYRFTRYRMSMRIAVDYGRADHININDLRKKGKNRFCLLAIRYDFTWHGPAMPGSQRFSWWLGACFENFELRQRVSISPGRYNEHKDEYLGIGPRIGGLWRPPNRSLAVGINLGVLFSLPYASQSMTRTDGCYSDKAYLWWFKPRVEIFLQYRVSSTHSVEFAFRRDAWIYGRNPYRGTRRPDFYSGSGYLLDWFSVKLNRGF